MPYQEISKLNKAITSYVEKCSEPILTLYLHKGHIVIKGDRFSINALAEEQVVRIELGRYFKKFSRIPRQLF